MRIFLVALLLASATAYADNLSLLVQQADTVVVGTPVLSKTGAITGIAVDRWYKQPVGAQARQQVSVLSPEIAQPAPILHAKGELPPYRGLWFLQTRGQTNRLLEVQSFINIPVTLRNYYFAVNVLPERCPVEFQAQVTSPARLDYELAGVLACSASAEVANGAPAELLTATRDVRAPGLRTAFLALSAMPGSRQKAIGIAGLLSLEDKAGIEVLESQYRNITVSDQNAILADQRYWYFPRTDSVDALGQLLLSLIVEGNLQSPLLKSTAMALKVTHTRETVPYLARLLQVQNQDEETRQYYLRTGLDGIRDYLSNAPQYSKEELLDAGIVTTNLTNQLPVLQLRGPTPAGSADGNLGLAQLRGLNPAANPEAAPRLLAWLRSHQLI